MTPPTAIHLVRHGRVDNPNHVVYADLPGFDLDGTGVLQAHATGRHLSDRHLAAVVSSPLARALHTASAIAAHHDLQPTLDPRLVEWNVSHRWRGRTWEELPTSAPGEVEHYLADPTDLPFATESIHDLVDRLVASIEQHASKAGETVFVTHQDPIGAAVLALTGTPLDKLRSSPAGHGSVTTLTRNHTTWTVEAVWEPLPR